MKTDVALMRLFLVTPIIALILAVNLSDSFSDSVSAFFICLVLLYFIQFIIKILDTIICIVYYYVYMRNNMTDIFYRKLCDIQAPILYENEKTLIASAEKYFPICMNQENYRILSKLQVAYLASFSTEIDFLREDYSFIVHACYKNAFSRAMCDYAGHEYAKKFTVKMGIIYDSKQETSGDVQEVRRDPYGFPA